MTTNCPKRIVIVGGVAGGASAAARARRLCENCEIIVFERGPHVSFANCGLPYFVGGEIAEQDSLLVQTPASLKSPVQSRRARQDRGAEHRPSGPARSGARTDSGRNPRSLTTRWCCPRARRR